AAAPPSAETQQALERVLAGPDRPSLSLDEDNQARLLYAGAVAASDPVRAGFVQLQIQSAAKNRFDAMPLRKRADEILRVHGAGWTPAALPKPVYRRGFVARVTVDVQMFISRATELYRLAPITEIVVTGAKAGLRDLLASPRLSRIRVLVLSAQNLA